VLGLRRGADRAIEPRLFALLDAALAEHEHFSGITPDEMRRINTDQLLAIKLDRAAAVAHLPHMLTSPEEREWAMELARQIVLFGNKPNRAEQRVIEELEGVLGAE